MIIELSITEEQFAKAVEAAQEKPQHKKIVDYMLSVDDFVAFKEMMRNRNKELNEQAHKKLFILICFRMLGKKGRMKEDKIPELDIEALEKAELNAAIKISMQIEVFLLPLIGYRSTERHKSKKRIKYCK